MTTKKFDDNGNNKDSNGFEEWTEYDSNGNVTKYKNSNEYEEEYYNQRRRL